MEHYSFNPHSSFRPSATREQVLAYWAEFNVSILTRAFARVQRAGLAWAPGPPPFQSSLELSPECNSVTAGFTWTGSTVSILTRAFARVQHLGRIRDSLGGIMVSILTRAFARVQRLSRWRRSGRPGAFQSSLELSPECNPGLSLALGAAIRFQSSLELSPECNTTPL